MREIMISIQPQFVQKILNKEKTIEIRKTKPSCELPCKVYIYCTKAKNHFDTCVIHNKNKDKNDYSFCEIGNGKVVAEFTLNKVEDYLDGENFVILGDRTSACLTFDEIMKYANGNPLYAWYIDDLKIYDKPKLLQNFFIPCDGCDKMNTKRCTEEISDCKAKTITMCPQSWQYVQYEEL